MASLTRTGTFATDPHGGTRELTGPQDSCKRTMCAWPTDAWSSTERSSSARGTPGTRATCRRSTGVEERPN
jgi:hypothetical protein